MVEDDSDDGTSPVELSADEATVRAARSDLAAFAPLYDRYHDAIYGYCLRTASDDGYLVFARDDSQSLIDDFRPSSIG